MGVGFSLVSSLGTLYINKALIKLFVLNELQLTPLLYHSFQQLSPELVDRWRILSNKVGGKEANL